MATVNEKMTALADEIRTLNGSTSTLSIDTMTTEVNSANTEVSSQADLIAQIATALEGKAGGSGSGSNTVSVTVSVNTHKCYGFDADGNALAVSSGTYDFLCGIVYCVAPILARGSYVLNGSLYMFTADGGSMSYSSGAT